MSLCSTALAGRRSRGALSLLHVAHVYHGVPRGWHRSFRKHAWSTWCATPSPDAVDVPASNISWPGAAARGAALLDDRYLGPSRYGFQLAAFLDYFDRSQVLVIASEVLRDRPRRGTERGV